MVFLIRFSSSGKSLDVLEFELVPDVSSTTSILIFLGDSSIFNVICSSTGRESKDFIVFFLFIKLSSFLLKFLLISKNLNLINNFVSYFYLNIFDTLYKLLVFELYFDILQIHPHIVLFPQILPFFLFIFFYY